MNYSEILPAIASFLKASEKPLLVVVGPTASGKTGLAVDLAKQFDGEVINADSRQVYREMEIGNALTRPEEMQGIPHHLFGEYPIDYNLTVAEYKLTAEKLIEDILKRGKLPIICGGTFLWVDAVVDNFQIPEGKPDMELRSNLEKLSVDELLKKLEEVDPQSAESLKHERNKRYIIRALEIYEQSGRTKSELAVKGERKYDVFKIAPLREREEIYDCINKRTVQQFEGGMIDEVQALVDKYADSKPRKLIDLGWPGITSIGCKEVIPMLEGEKTPEETLAHLQQNNRNYAKRQLTWLRKDAEIHWIRA